MRSISRFAAVALALLASARAHAQELVFQHIPWGTLADTVRARLEALGYTYRGIVDRGDRTFDRRDGAQVTAFMRAERAVGFRLVDPARGEAMPARFQALADSLQAAYGAPIDTRPEMRMWEAGLTSAGAMIYRNPATGEQWIEAGWRGPGWYDEMQRRGELLNLGELPPTYTTVAIRDGSRISVDTASLRRRAGGLLRARFRIDYPRVRTDVDDRYDALEYGMDFDCGAGRTRLVSRSTFLSGRRGRSESAEGLPWSAARAGSDEARGLDAVCRVGGGGPAVVARPDHVRSFGPVPAGWVVASQSEVDRWIVDSTSVAARGGGVYGAGARVERGERSQTEYGPADGMRVQAEVDCGAERMRYTSATLQLAGRDVHAVRVSPEFANWAPARDSGIAAVVCRVARERKL